MIGLFAAASLLAYAAVACDPALCVVYNGWAYMSIDGNPYNDTTIGCTDSPQSVPAGWEIAGDDADARAVASSHPWGAHCIAHSTNSPNTATTMFSGHCDGQIVVSGGRYKVNYCHMRILIRIPPTTTTTVTATATATTATPTATTTTTSSTTCGPGYRMDEEIRCLPLTGTVLAGVVAPQLNISDAGGAIRFRVEVEPPPLTYERTNFSFALDVDGTPKSEASDNCSSQWQHAANTFTLELSYAELDGACHLNMTHTADYIVRQGFVSVFLLGQVGDSNVTDALQWHFPVTLTVPKEFEAVLGGVAVSEAVSLPQHTVNLGALRSQLNLFETNLFVKPKALALFHDGDRAFLSLSVVDVEGAALAVSVEAAWLSQLPDPQAQVVHNLSDSIDVLDKTDGRIHIAVGLRACVSCYLHVMGAVTPQESSGKGRLLTPARPHHVLHNLAVVVASLEQPPEQSNGGKGGSTEGQAPEPGSATAETDPEGLAAWFIPLAAAGAVALLFSLLMGAVCVVKRVRRRGARRYTLESFPEPDIAECPGLEFNQPLSCDMLDPAPALVAQQLAQVFGAATDVGHGRDVRMASGHSMLRVVDVWEVKNPFLKGRYEAELNCRLWEAGRLAEVKFPGQGHVPYVPTTSPLDRLRRAWGLEEACNEAILLHGTKMEHVLKIVQGGFNERLADDQRPGGVLFGNGAYFAEDAGKVDQYATPFTAGSSAAGARELQAELYGKFGRAPPEQPVFFVVVCRVVLGLPLYTQDGKHTMVHPPTETGVDPNTSIFTSASHRELIAVPGVSPDIRYHALIAERGARILRFREFVTFHGNAVFPSHIVAYSRE